MTLSPRVLILAQDGNSAHIVFNTLQSAFEICAVVLEQPVPRKELVARRIKKLGLRAVAGQLAFRALVVPALSKASNARIAEICARNGLDRSPPPPQACVQVPSVNSSECARVLCEYAPDVVVVNGTRIIAAPTLNAVKASFINIHTGLTPLYRGVHGGYWALAEGEPERFGVTIHRVDTGIDTGEILAQALIEPTARDNFVTYPYLQYAAAMPLLKRAVAEELAGTARALAPPAGKSRLWSHPTLGQYLSNLVRKRVW